MRKNIIHFLKRYCDLFFTLFFILVSVFAELFFFNTIGDISLLKSLIDSSGKILMVISLSFIMAGAIFQILSLLKKTSKFVDENWDSIFKLIFITFLVFHLGFTFNAEQFSLFLSIASLPLFSSLSQIIKNRSQSSRATKKSNDENSIAKN